MFPECSYKNISSLVTVHRTVHDSLEGDFFTVLELKIDRAWKLRNFYTRRISTVIEVFLHHTVTQYNGGCSHTTLISVLEREGGGVSPI